MNHQELFELAREVVEHLRASGFEDDAIDLELLIGKVNNFSSETKSAARDIQARCHIKWLGDVPIKSISFNDWTHLLARVKRAAETFEEEIKP